MVSKPSLGWSNFLTVLALRGLRGRRAFSTTLTSIYSMTSFTPHSDNSSQALYPHEFSSGALQCNDIGDISLRPLA